MADVVMQSNPKQRGQPTAAPTSDDGASQRSSSTDMGVIKRKNIVKGNEGGLKYICDVCSADITSTVRIRCAHVKCDNYDLCVPCFSQGAASRDHDPRTHPFSVIEQHSLPMYTRDWGADEELLLLEGLEVYGIGSWADVADHIGGFRNKNEVRDHYIKTYIESAQFPLPENADPKDLSLIEEIPREAFQAQKKARIEKRKEEAKEAHPATPKTKPTASVPACHEIQGYMPGRLEFETEFCNEAEEAVQHMQFDPGEGINVRTGELEPEMELKTTVMDIYNDRLTQRADRKRVIYEHDLLAYRKNTNIDKKRTKEERDIHNRCKPFARMINHKDFEDFSSSLEYEHNLRQAISQLQDWRQKGIRDLKTGEKYEQEKAHRLARPAPTGQFDRIGGVRATNNKPPAPVETNSNVAALTGSELPDRLKPGFNGPAIPKSSSELFSPEIHRDTHASKNTLSTSSSSHSGNKGPLTNGNPNTTISSQNNHQSQKDTKPKYTIAPLSGTIPLKWSKENSADLHLLTKEEAELCSTLRLQPKPYLVIKEGLIREAMKTGGCLKRKSVREVAKIDPARSARIFDFFIHAGWIQKA